MAKSNRSFSAASRNVDEFIKTAIEEDFPSIQVSKILERQLDSDQDMLGSIETKSGERYHFMIEKGDPRPMLRRID